MPTTFTPGKLSNQPALGYTPGSAVAAYTPVVVGTHPYMANIAIPANTRGSLLQRGGTYRVTTGQIEGGAPAHGADVYWNAATALLVTTPASEAAGNYQHFGRISPSTPVVTVSTKTYSFEVEHDPAGETVVKS